ncbi:TPA: HD domain-containing phosphohydrolase [Aeromonas salmonicida]
MFTSHAATILIVDDSPENLMVLTDLLSPTYRVLAAQSGEKCLRIATGKTLPDLILLDVMMPGMDGYEVLKQLRTNPETSRIPVVLLTALADSQSEEYGLSLGAADYITKPIKPAIVQARVRTQLEAEVARRMTENDLIQQVSIRALAHLAEIRDPETGNHILRTQGYVRLLANALASHPRFIDTLTPRYIDLLSRSAPLHDIGKVGIPDHVLLKPAKLTVEEWEVMRTHAKLGSDAIEEAERDIEQPLAFLTLAKEIAHWHHEKWDGSGYPDGLRGDEIPLSARLMALADVFDALINVRVYKAAMPYDEARALILSGTGQHFDPDVVTAFDNHFDQFVAIAERYTDENEAPHG